MTASLKAAADGLSASLQVGGVDKAVVGESGLAPQIFPVTASVGSNALTVTLNPCCITFRSATVGSGTTNTRSVGVAISCTVPSGATLGTINATAARIAVLAIDNAGTVEVAIVNTAGGNDLSETGLISTTALSAGSTANNVIYSTAARTNVPYRVVGFIDITEATAGTWATAPSTIQGAGGNAVAGWNSLGYGQTWQDVTGSRALSTTYYNTTGKPIAVMIGLTGSIGSGTGIVITVSGVALPLAFNAPVASTTSYPCAFAVVPPGASYSAANSSSGTLNKWSELR